MKKGGNLSEGLSKKMGFTPEESSPKGSKVSGTARPQHDNPMVKRSVRKKGA